MSISPDVMQVVPVSSNVSWANVNVIALYCTQYKALFGSVNLKEAMAMKMSGVSCFYTYSCPCWAIHQACEAAACVLSMQLAL